MLAYLRKMTKKEIFWPLLIFIIALVLRLHNSSELFFWNIDEDRFALTAKRILIDHRPVLIGYSLPRDIYLGPIFPYILSFWYFLVGMNPFGLPVIAAILTAITAVLVFFVGKTIFESKRIGTIASLLYAFSSLAVVYSKVLTELTIAPIIALLTYLILYQNLKSKKPVNLIWLWVVLIVAVQNEGSSFSLLVLVAAVWLIYRFKIPIRKLAFLLIMMVGSHISLLIFDLRHNFFLTKSFVGFFSGGVSGQVPLLAFENLTKSFEIFPNTLARFLLISGEKSISGQILPCADLITQRENALSGTSFFFAVIILLFFITSIFLKKKRAYGQQIIFIHFAVMLIGIFLFNVFMGDWFFEWILVIFLPGFSLMIAYFFKKISENIRYGNLLTFTILGVLMFANLKSIYLTKDAFGLAAKAEATEKALREVDKKPFFLDSIGSCFAQGYNYLFWYFGNFPTHSYSDDQFTPTYYPRSTNKKPSLGAVMVNPSKEESEEFKTRYNFYKQKAKKIERVGAIEILIVELN